MCHLVLIVDDDPDIRETLRLVSEEEGYDAVVARDGAEALDLLAAGVQPCVILLDLMMPRMTGLQFLDHRRAAPALAHAPVVVVSAARDAARALAAGAVAVVEKPVDLGTILDTLALHCHPRRP